MKIKVSQGRVNVAVHRQTTAPSWLLLHGFMGSHHDYDKVAKRLPGTVIVPDLLGHGETEARAGVGFDMTTQVAVLHELLHQSYSALLPLTIVGYSMGGRVAIAYAASYPADVLRLVVESGRPGLATEAERLARQAHDAQLADRLLTAGLPAFVLKWEQLPLFASQRHLSVVVQQAVRVGRLRQSPSNLARSLREMGTGQQPNYWPELPKITVPVTLLTGELDTKFTAIARMMLAQLPKATHNVIAGVGHNVHLEAPDRYVASLVREASYETD
ncbi:2-succinyl-6-hydroxy-2,4-cyclohexadiene-1-carboxylate synthase [Secundilactobacillus kimchicus]|uniref:2-succinyl-6-hydroxy-2, 4-cyclohexadiene-1-carboxylate synthase n=1 Tax=Secundilactobacillus kimchicus TaxID=528209 RepID=UPI001C01473B|nr:2-succinyl-6-hydroxy-2,4-cyclohexadiene-1-carboxylate synthase [Secundilactobacillus kimchicus]MBT9672691.1 2-succinyl-6-hydroxy-2,4-cyclohexadiene-1-carboxylate synthase [Secundilactobacillus kimchicus]